MAAFTLAGCDPICTDGISRPGQGQVARTASGTCVQLVVTRPDAGEDDGSDGGGLPAGDGGVCGAGPGWTTQVVDEGIDVLTAAFVFDAQGVGHYAYSKGSNLHVGTTRPGDAPTRLWDIWTAYDVALAVAADGTHHVLLQQGNNVAYASDAGGSWKARMLAEGWMGAIAVDAQGLPHVLIRRASPKVGYLYGTLSTRGEWSLSPIEALGISDGLERMAVDANGHVHVVYVRWSGSTSQVFYASNVSGTWTVEPLEWRLPLNSPRLRVGLEVDPTGRPSLLASDGQGASLWVKEDSGWKAYGLGAFLSRGPALSRSAFAPDLRHALLDDAALNAGSTGSASQLVVQTLDGTSTIGTTPPLVLETLDGGNAFPGPSSVQVDDQDQVQVGFSYVHYFYPPDGGAVQTTRGLRYARYCP